MLMGAAFPTCAGSPRIAPPVWPRTSPLPRRLPWRGGAPRVAPFSRRPLRAPSRVVPGLRRAPSCAASARPQPCAWLRRRVPSLSCSTSVPHLVAFALHALSQRLAMAANRLALLPCSPLRRLLIVAPTLHLAQHALALHLFLEHAQCAVHVVVAHEYLHFPYLGVYPQSGGDPALGPIGSSKTRAVRCQLDGLSIDRSGTVDCIGEGPTPEDK